ncbi:MAG: ATP-binding protein [Burkholderiaceae bacterium]
MLPDLQPDLDDNIVGDNIRAVQAIYFAHQLESMQAYKVVDRLVELFQHGLLPLGRGRAASLLKRYASTADRLSAQQRQELYARALGEPGGAACVAQANHEFHSIWLRLVASVALFDRHQGRSSESALPRAVSAAAIWRTARASAANASAHGARLVGPVKRLSIDTNLLRAVLQAPEIRKAFGARDMWQVIEQVAGAQLGQARNVVRRRTLAHAGSAILQWLAEHADALNEAAGPAAAISFPDPSLIDAVQAWLIASREREQPDADAQPADSFSLSSPAMDLRAVASELARIMGIEALLSRREPMAEPELNTEPHRLVAVFHGGAGTGKTLGAHAVAASLSRDLVRVDLRQIVGKYIGETEKNLEAVLARADRTGAVLLLDEADALFGKRTGVQDSHDRYANSEIEYLLQRLRTHQGLVIIESKVMPAGADGGLLAGLSHAVHFPM